MNNEIDNQAAKIETMMPRIAGRLFTLAVNQPTSELPVAQLRTCNYLLTVGSATTTELAEELGISVSAATQIGDRLEKIDFVERAADCNDRRVKRLKLTETGLGVLTARKARRVARVRQALSKVPENLRADLVVALGALLDASLTLSTAADDIVDESGNLKYEETLTR